MELALGLEHITKEELPGRAKLRDSLARDPRPDVLLHARTQLELAVLALQTGRIAELEPSQGGGPPADVAFTVAEDRLVVEIREVLVSDEWRRKSREVDDCFAQIRAAEDMLGVRVEGQLSRHLSKSEMNQILEGIEERSRLIHLGAVPPSLRRYGVSLRVVGTSTVGGSGLSGPAVGEDLWPRLRNRIREKAEVAQKSGANWLRLDVRSGLWQGTSWASRSLSTKLQDLAAIARPELAGLDGLVISSGLVQAQGAFHDEHAFTDSGDFALRRAIRPARVRETLLVAADHVENVVLDSWRSTYANEPQYLDWSLDRLSLPPSELIFG